MDQDAPKGTDLMIRKLALTSDKRRSRRYAVPMALALECGERKDRVGIALDVSPLGARFNTPSHFEEGDAVSMTLMHKSDIALAKCTGRVVWVERADTRSDLPWRFVTSVTFERPLVEIESTLRRSVPLGSARS